MKDSRNNSCRNEDAWIRNDAKFKKNEESHPGTRLGTCLVSGCSAEWLAVILAASNATEFQSEYFIHYTRSILNTTIYTIPGLFPPRSNNWEEDARRLLRAHTRTRAVTGVIRTVNRPSGGFSLLLIFFIFDQLFARKWFIAASTATNILKIVLRKGQIVQVRSFYCSLRPAIKLKKKC